MIAVVASFLTIGARLNHSSTYQFFLHTHVNLSWNNRFVVAFNIILRNDSGVFDSGLVKKISGVKVLLSHCLPIATFIQNIAGRIILTGKNVAQISNGISNPVISRIIYWLIRILICGGCLVGAGILVAFIGIKIAGLYKKCCWDMLESGGM